MDRQVADAYDELRSLDLEEGYTPRVAAGRAACLDEARRALQASRGRPTRDGPAVQVAHDALPGALALLQQVRTGLGLALRRHMAGLCSHTAADLPTYESRLLVFGWAA